MLTLERADSGRRVTWLSIVGLILVPLIVAGGFIWAVWNADDRMGRVQAAIVNEDDPVKVDGQTVPLGRQLAAGLVDRDEDNYDWVLSDTEDAKKGIEDGTYAAVVTIPKNFSADATSYGKDDGTLAQQANIKVETSQVGALSDSALGTAIAQTATTAMNKGLTENYLDNIYLGFNDIGKNFQDTADAAGQLDDGATQLDDGVGQSARGAGELSKGMDELSANGPQLASGAGDLAKGAGDLSKGAGDLDDGVGDLKDGTGQLADGNRQLSDGVDEYTKGVDTLAKGLGGDGIEKLQTGASDVADGANGVSSGLGAYQQGLKDRAASEEAGNQACEEGGIPAGPACESFKAGLSAGLSGAADGLDEGSPSLKTAASGVAKGAGQVSDGVDELAGGMGQAQEGADQLTKAGADLRKGASAAADGAEQLDDGVGDLRDGTAQLSDGASQLSDGASQLSDGVTQYTDGVSQAATGTSQLSTGLGQLEEGSGKLADGTGQLSDGLARGAGQIPTYDEPERKNLKDVVSAPVASGDDEAPALFADAPALGLLLILALWIGALITYLVVRAIPSSALSSRASSLAIMARGLIPGAAVALVQALVLSVVAQIVLQLNLFDFSALFVLAAFAGIVFTAINYALVAWFGGFGRVFSVMLLVLAVSGSILAAVPAFFDGVKPALPLTPAFNGFASIITGGPGLGAAYGGLFLWLIVGLAAGAIAVARQRTASAAQLAAIVR